MIVQRVKKNNLWGPVFESAKRIWQKINLKYLQEKCRHRKP